MGTCQGSQRRGANDQKGTSASFSNIRPSKALPWESARGDLAFVVRWSKQQEEPGKRQPRSRNQEEQRERYLEGQLIREGVSPSESFWRNHSCLSFPVLPCTKNKTSDDFYENVTIYTDFITLKAVFVKNNLGFLKSVSTFWPRGYIHFMEFLGHTAHCENQEIEINICRSAE